MPRLTDTQLMLLSSAAARSDLVVPPAMYRLKAEGPAVEQAMRSLLRRGMIAASSANANKSLAAETASAGRVPVFTITPSGLAAVGVDENTETPHATGAARSGHDALTDEAPPRKAKRLRQRKATGAPNREQEAMEAATSVSEERPTAGAAEREAGELMRRTTKKDRLITLLSAEHGVDVATLSAKLGWREHTVRAALTGLRKAGLRIEAVTSASGGRRLHRIAPNRATGSAA